MGHLGAGVVPDSRRCVQLQLRPASLPVGPGLQDDSPWPRRLSAARRARPEAEAGGTRAWENAKRCARTAYRPGSGRLPRHPRGAFSSPTRTSRFVDLGRTYNRARCARRRPGWWVMPARRWWTTAVPRGRTPLCRPALVTAGALDLQVAGRGGAARPHPLDLIPLHRGRHPHLCCSRRSTGRPGGGGGGGGGGGWRSTSR